MLKGNKNRFFAKYAIWGQAIYPLNTKNAKFRKSRFFSVFCGAQGNFFFVKKFVKQKRCIFLRKNAQKKKFFFVQNLNDHFCIFQAILMFTLQERHFACTKKIYRRGVQIHLDQKKRDPFLRTCRTNVVF